MKFNPFDYLQSIVRGEIAPETEARLARWMMLLALVAGVAIIMSAPGITVTESIFLEHVEDFVRSPGLDFPITYIDLKVSLYSIPFRLGLPLGSYVQLFLIRALGLGFVMIAIWLFYQSATRLAKNNSFISLAVLALAATNNQLMAASATIGGDAFLICFMAFFLFELVEIATRGALVDIIVALALAFMMGQVDFEAAQEIAMPGLFMAVIISMISANADSLKRIFSSPGARIALGIGAIAAVFIGQRVDVLGSLLFAPVAAGIGIANLRAWPEIFTHITHFFAITPNLPSAFFYIRQTIYVLMLLTGALALAGVGRFVLIAVSERVKVARGASVAAADAGVGGGAGLVGDGSDEFEPEPATVDWRAALVVGLVLFAVLAANNVYPTVSGLKQPEMFWLVLPITFLVAFGLNQAAKIRQAEMIAMTCFSGLVTFNVAALLLSILFRPL